MIFQDLPLVPAYLTAHAVLMSVTFVILFPLGAILIRVVKSKKAVWVHVGCQLLGWVLMLGGLATGIRVGKIIDRLHNNAHTILGTLVVVLMLLQPFIGFIHHRQYLKKHTASAWTKVHVWYGRVLILLGILNGGLGLQLAANTRAGEIAYGTVGGLVGLAFCFAIVGKESGKWPKHHKVASDGERAEVQERTK